MFKTTRIVDGQAPDASDGDLDLGVYIRVLWRHRWMIVIGTFVLAAVTLVANLLMPPQYEATAVLIVNQSKLGEAPAPTVNTATYSRLLANRGVADIVIKKLALDRPPTELTADQFLNRLQIEEIAGTNLFRVSLSLGGAKTAADAVNTFAEEAVTLNRRLNQGEAVSARDFINTQLEQAKVRLQQAESALLEFKRTAQVDLVKKDTGARLDERGKILAMLVELETEKARLARAEEEMAKQERVLTVKRSIDTEPALMEAARSGAGAGLTPLLGLQMKNEFINPVYEALEQQVMTSRTKISALERQRHEMVDVLKLDAAQMKQLTELFSKEIEISRLELEHDIARKVYSDLSARFEEARIQVASRTAELQVVDPATAPTTNVSPKILQNVLIAAAVGCILMMLGVLLSDYFRRTLGGPRRSQGA